MSDGGGEAANWTMEVLQGEGCEGRGKVGKERTKVLDVEGYHSQFRCTRGGGLGRGDDDFFG